MKKLSIRARVTLLTAACLTVACLALYISLLWLADVKIVQAVNIGPVDADQPIQAESAFDSQMEGESIMEGELPEEEIAEDMLYGFLAESGLQTFRWLGVVVMLLVVGLGSILAWFVSGVSIAPVRQLSQKLESVDAQEMKLDVSEFSAGDELNKLADAFSRMMERIQTAFEREKRFSSAAAHELKTPLAVMQSSIDVLALSEEPTSEEYQEAMEDMEAQVGRLTALVTDLLAFTRAGRPASVWEIQAMPLVEKLLDELSCRYPELTIRKQLMPVRLAANQPLLERAIYNLLDNAAKYSPQGSTVSVQLIQKDNDCVFSVADEGCGISPESATHIFEPFYRDDPSRNRSIAGVGLGLSFVKEFANAYGGQISCEPVCPHGTVFTLSLPLTAPNTEAQ